MHRRETLPDIILLTDQPDAARDAERVAASLQQPLLTAEPTSTERTQLRFTDEGTELCNAGEPPGKGVVFDLVPFLSQAEQRGLRSRDQPIARALGKTARTIVDATAGLGRDAAQLASMGRRVHAIERHPVVFALLNDALRRAGADDRASRTLADRLTLELGDARTILAERDWTETLGSARPDVICIDPMFPPKRKKSALPRRDILTVGQLVGPDEDAAELLAIARAATAHRVVVKRPPWADPVAPDPVAEHGGKLVRYDVYLP